LKAIEFYSGVGGFSLGVKRSGFNVIGAFELDWRHVETYNRNFKYPVGIVEDVSNISFSQNDYGLDLSELDLVFGGPPCQGFSNGGRQSVYDERNNQILKFASLVSQLQPRAFVMENVRGILNSKFKPKLQEFYSILKKNGYTIYDPLLLNAKDFYVPQDRKRVFFIGLRKSITKCISFQEPKRSRTTENEVTVGDALRDILHVNFAPNQRDIYTKKSNKLDTLYYKSLNHREDHKIWKNKNELNSLTGFTTTLHSNEVVSRFSKTKPGTTESISRYKRLSLNGLSPTLRAGTIRGKGQFMAPRPIHPIHNRCITTREAARLHSFPDWFDFFPTKWYGMMQIGNSVPPHLAESVSMAIYKTLS
jgi:DNA (cytosine-5)-methyltransferase 1